MNKIYIYKRGLKKTIKKMIPEKIFHIIKCIVRGNYFYFFWLFPIKNNKIIFCNYRGKGFGDNGKYIVKEIIQQKLNYDIVWLIEKDLPNKSNFPKEVRTVKYGSLRGLFELATSKIWVDNCRKYFFPPKRKEQFYIQTWHGGIALKRVEKDAEEKLSSGYIKSAIKDSRMIDLFISNSKFCTNMYRAAFWYNGKILECGSPRNDIFFDSNLNINQKVRDYFNISGNTNILIYAPTFRADYSIDIYKINFNNLIETLEKTFGGEWCILVRLHPNISDKADFIEYDEKIINATQYDDMYELLKASHILITDYSSTMFEFSLTNKPVFLYAPDIESYKKERNFYFDIYTLPYSLAETEQQLCNVIVNFDRDKYLTDLERFFNQLGIIEDGNASKRVVEKIKEIISMPY